MLEESFDMENQERGFKIISGGQTGVDRSALDAALTLNIPCGGWCPNGGKAEDGPIPPHFPLQETPSSDYRVRTEKNVTDSDGTLILTHGPVTGATAYTVTLAKKHKKPYFILDLALPADPKPVLAWLLPSTLLAPGKVRSQASTTWHLSS
jgi:hypothetical protein